MKQVNKNLIVKNTVFMYVRMIVVMVIALFTSRIILQSLGSSDYGLNNVVGGVVALFIYISGSLGSSSSRFIAYEIGKGQKTRITEVVRASFRINFYIALLFVTVAETIGLWFVNRILVIPPDRLYACNIVYQTVVITSVFSLLQVTLSALIISHEKMGVYASMSIISALLLFLVALMIKYYDGDKLILFSILQLLVGLLLFFAYLTYCKFKFPKYCVIWGKCSGADLISMVNYSFWNILGSATSSLRVHGVSIVMNLFFGPVVNAANAIAVQISRLVRNFSENFTISVRPQITKSYAVSDYSSIRSLLYQGGKISFFLISMICFPLLFETNFFLSLWLVEFPPFSITLTRLTLLLAIVEIFNQTIDSVLQAAGDVKDYQICTSAILIFILPFAYVAYSMGFPVYASYIITLFLTVLAQFCKLYFLRKKTGFGIGDYIVSVGLRCIIIAAFSITGPIVLINILPQCLLRVVSVCLVSWFSLSFFFFFLGLSQSERIYVFQNVKRFYNIR